MAMGSVSIPSKRQSVVEQTVESSDPVFAPIESVLAEVVVCHRLWIVPEIGGELIEAAQNFIAV
jgi:hypothetical protein